jgi:hypothetical protein
VGAGQVQVLNHLENDTTLPIRSLWETPEDVVNTIRHVVDDLVNTGGRPPFQIP